MKKFMALLLATVMVMAMSMSAFAAPVVNDHTITITNTDQNVTHKYEAYQVFKGNLDAKEEKLSDIDWGNGVDGAAILKDLKASTDDNLKDKFKNCVTATDVAKVIATFDSTSGADQNAGAIDAVADIIAKHLATKAADFAVDSEDPTGTTYVASVKGDGYYFIKDTTKNLNNDETKWSDTLSKYLLSVIKDTTIVAKDTPIEPDKKILGEGETKVAADSAAIGDEVEFEVTIDVPNTKKYKDHFVFQMNDTLPAGLTFFGLKEITINGTALPAANYTLTAKTDDAAFTVPTDAATAVTTTGGQVIKVVFKDFKAYVEENDLIGKTISIKYKAVVNEKAEFGATGNENEVKFDYSTDPNHVYDGDDFEPTDPKGTTPKKKTKTYVTTLQILKQDDEKKALEGATFTLAGEALNHVLVTGEKFEKAPYTAAEGKTETVETGDYWLLKDGSYTSTDPKTEGINDTQYADTETKYVKVSYQKDVVNTKSVTLTGTSGKDGIIKFEGLNAGTYTLTETIAPDGFNLLTKPITIVVDWTDPTAEGASEAIKASGGFSVGDGSAEGLTMDADGATYKITVVNESGSVLPSTGGIGTTLFYIVGSVLVVSAVVLLISKKRMSAR